MATKHFFGVEPGACVAVCQNLYENPPSCFMFLVATSANGLEHEVQVALSMEQATTLRDSLDLFLTAAAAEVRERDDAEKAALREELKAMDARHTEIIKRLHETGDEDQQYQDSLYKE
jgi:hypothetical protein